MFQEFKERFERAITKVTQEADAAISKVTQEADAAFTKVSLEADAAISRVTEGADAALTRIHSSDSKDSDTFESALRNCQCIQEPSSASVECAQTIFANLFDQNNRLNEELIHTKLDKLSLNDNILLVEDKDHYNLLHKAIIFNNEQLLDILIQHKFDVSRSTPRVHCNVSRRCSHYNLGALHLACYLGHENIVHTLIEAGTDPQQDARIYTSALVNCPAHLQPRVLACDSYSNDVTIAARCGNREPVFFAVLGDHVGIVQLFLEKVFNGSSRRPVSQYSYLLQLACRVGSEHCIEYLLDKFPGAVNRADSDGLPPVVLVMRHKNGLYLTQMLLNAGADTHLLDDLWHKGNNILHLLYTSGLWVDNRTSLSTVSQLCLDQGVDVNSQDQHDHLPLHHLLEQLNGMPEQPQLTQHLPYLRQMVQHLSIVQFSVGQNYLTDADKDLLSCIKQMIKQGSCTDGELAFVNINPVTRYSETLIAERLGRPDVIGMLSGHRYGLDNMLIVADWMIEHASNKSEYCFSILVCFLGSVLYMDPFYETVNHSYELLENESILSGYTDLLKLVLPHCKPERLNSLIINQLPPILYVMSKLSEAPSMEGYIVPVNTAQALTNILRLLLEAGCSPQIEIETRHGSPRMMGGFDMLMQVLDSMQENRRSTQHLVSLRIFTELLLEYGARTVVFRKLLYGASHTEAPWCYTTPSHSFLFQFLQFGAQNLHYIGVEYEALFFILCNQADGYVLQFVLNTVYAHFTEMHAQCTCAGECMPFRGLLQMLLHKCRPLKQLCRQVVLRNVPNYHPRALKSLPLPPALRHYLLDFSE